MLVALEMKNLKIDFRKNLFLIWISNYAEKSEDADDKVLISCPRSLRTMCPSALDVANSLDLWFNPEKSSAIRFGSVPVSNFISLWLKSSSFWFWVSSYKHLCKVTTVEQSVKRWIFMSARMVFFQCSSHTYKTDLLYDQPDLTDCFTLLVWRVLYGCSWNYV